MTDPLTMPISKLKKVFIIMASIVGIVGCFAGCRSAVERILFSLVSHPQTPTERPYIVKEVVFINPHDGTKIAGELTYPSTGDSFPAFVLVSGHEAGEPGTGRNCDITGHKYFLVISHLLTMRGYAVLRYDDRGTGESSGDYATASDNEFASDAAAALKWLRERSGIKLVSSGFLGHSQGGSKSLLAAYTEKPDYIIGLAGIVIETTAEVVIRQNRDINNAKGVDPSITDQQIQELKDIFKIIRASEDRDEVKKRLRQYAMDAGVTNEKHIQKFVDEFGSNWWFLETHRDQKALIQDYDGPVLALFGSKDLIVSASANELSIRELLRHPQSETYTFDGLNHIFQKARKGIGPEEYWEIETTIEEEVIEKIDVWIKSILNSANLGDTPSHLKKRDFGSGA